MLTSIEYDYNFSNMGLGFGIEIAPTSFTKLVSPFSEQIFVLILWEGIFQERKTDMTVLQTSFSDFRMGVNFDAGMEFKVSSKKNRNCTRAKNTT